MGSGDSRDCFKVAAGLLARREHSVNELRTKLRARAFDETMIADTLERLRREGLVCDERFVDAYVRSRANRGFGPVRVRQELLGHGVDETLIEHYLALVDWTALANGVWRKRFKGTVPDGGSAWLKQARFLQYRGFGMEHIKGLMGSDDWD